MIIGNIYNLEGKVIENPNAKKTLMKVLVSPKEGWDGYVMREIEVEEQGYTPKHSHPWPHINYMIDGDGELLVGDKVTKVTKGSFAFVPENTIHQFRNTGNETFRFICIVPEKGHQL